MKIYLPIVLAFSAIMTPSAFAATTIFTGDTTDGLTYNRPVASSPNNTPPTQLSTIGIAVRYIVIPFQVTVSGNYNFLNHAEYDSHLGIHRDVFDPSNGLLNAVSYSDDFFDLDAGFANLPLLSGVSYFAISTGFTNDDFGQFTLTIDGPGGIVGRGVPEPTVWAMLIFGFAAIGIALRRRRGSIATSV